MCTICLQLDKFADWEDGREMVRMARLESLINNVSIIPEEHLEEVEDYIQALQFIETGTTQE